jgi:hypothetical protein
VVFDPAGAIAGKMIAHDPEFFLRKHIGGQLKTQGLLKIRHLMTI